MRIKKNSFLIFGSLLMITALLNVFSVPGYAEAVKGQETSTPIQIQINERTLFISKVVAPQFGKYAVKGSGQVVTPLNDLTIAVTDTRPIDEKNSWSLYYNLTNFTSHQNKSIKQEVLISKGKLADENTDLKSYQSYPAEITSTTNHMLLKNDEKKDKYVYTIDKKDIKLYIPANQTPGTYQAVQTVYLANTPQSK